MWRKHKKARDQVIEDARLRAPSRMTLGMDRPLATKANRQRSRGHRSPSRSYRKTGEARSGLDGCRGSR